MSYERDAGVGDAGSDSESFHWGLPNGCRLRRGRGTDQGDGPWYSHVSDHRRSTLRGETWENPEVVRAAGRLWEQSWRSPALQNLCGAFSFRSKGPTPIPSMQTQWNICNRIHDISPEGSPSGHIKTNCAALSAAPLTTRSSDHSGPICGPGLRETSNREGLFNHDEMSTLVLYIFVFLLYMSLFHKQSALQYLIKREEHPVAGVRGSGGQEI